MTPEIIKVVFKPVMISKKQRKIFERRIMHHDGISYAGPVHGQNRAYYEYTFKADEWYQDADRMLKNLSGLFDGVMCWGYIEETYHDHEEYYNVLFNNNIVEKIGSQVSRVGAKTRKDYRILYGKDCVIYGLQSIVNPFDFIIYDRAYSPNEKALADYRMALLTKEEEKHEDVTKKEHKTTKVIKEGLPF